MIDIERYVIRDPRSKIISFGTIFLFSLRYKFETKDLLNLLENTYRGFPNLIKFLKSNSS